MSPPLLAGLFLLASLLSGGLACALEGADSTEAGAGGSAGGGGSGGSAGGCTGEPAFDCFDCNGGIHAPACTGGSWACEDDASCSAGGSGGGGAGGGGGGGGSGGAGGGGGGAVGTGGTGGAGGAGGSAPACEAADACESCLIAACEPIYCGCAASASCGGLIDCVSRCAAGDTACAQGCASANEGGIALATRVGDCSARACARSCPPATRLDPCQACLMVLCEAEVNSCFANEECVALVDCVSGCAAGDDTCTTNCGLSHWDGIDPAQALGDCRSGRCGVSCPQ